MARAAPPLQAPMADDKNNLSESWESFFGDMLVALGGFSGPVFIKGDEIVPDGIVDSLSIGNSSQPVHLNNMVWTDNLTAGYVAVVNPDNTISYEDPVDVFAIAHTGDIKFTLKSTADDGWVLNHDDFSIGSAASGAAARANADTEDLFLLIWNSISDTYAPVGGGRGASAQADFDADKVISLPMPIYGDVAAIAIADHDGDTDKANGLTAGGAGVALSLAEMPTHTHPGCSGGASTTSTENIKVTTANWTGTPTITTTSVGSGDAHANTQPWLGLTMMVKL